MSAWLLPEQLVKRFIDRETHWFICALVGLPTPIPTPTNTIIEEAVTVPTTHHSCLARVLL